MITLERITYNAANPRTYTVLVIGNKASNLLCIDNSCITPDVASIITKNYNKFKSMPEDAVQRVIVELIGRRYVKWLTLAVNKIIKRENMKAFNG